MNTPSRTADSDTRTPLALSDRALRTSKSTILALNARVKGLIRQGRDIALFGAGEPDFETPEHVRRATVAAVEAGDTRYTASAGKPELREAIAAKFQKDLGLSYAPDEVIVTAGAKMALFGVFQAVCNPGDEVVTFGPYWGSYLDIIGLSGATPVVVPTRVEDGFLPDPERLARALTPRTRAVLLNSPSNPTGAVYPPELLEKLAEVIAPTNALVVSDDIYEKILFDGRRFVNTAMLSSAWKARTVIVNGVSKAYAMTGFRIGFAAGPKGIIDGMTRIQDQSTSGPTAFAQAGALAALTGPQELLAPMVAEFQARRDLVVAGLRAIDGVTCPSPGGAFYALPSVAKFLGRRYGDRVVGTAAELCDVLLEHFDVACVPGEPFGAPDHIRLSFATSQEEIRKGVERIGKGLRALE